MVVGNESDNGRDLYWYGVRNMLFILATPLESAYDEALEKERGGE